MCLAGFRSDIQETFFALDGKVFQKEEKAKNVQNNGSWELLEGFFSLISPSLLLQHGARPQGTLDTDR